MSIRRTIHIIFLLLILALSSCQANLPTPPESTPTISPPAAGPAHPTGLPTSPSPLSPTPYSPSPSFPTLAPSPENLPNTQYTLSAVLDYGRHHLAVEQKIDYTNKSGEELADLLLIVEPGRYPGVFQLAGLAWEDGSPVAGHAWDGAWLNIPLASPLQPGESLSLSLAYELSLPSPQPSPDVRPIPFGYTARQTNLVDWYPFIPPYIPGQGWLAHPAGYFGEHLAYEAADFEVSIRLADARTDLVIAASALGEVDGDWQRYRFDTARNFAWSVSPDYQVLEEKVGAVTVRGYAFPAHAAAGEAALETTAQALALYSDLFGPYPHGSLSVVEADFLDGMEFDGLYFLSNAFYNLYSGGVDDYLTAIAAHETAHQWWYGLVGNDQALEPWLDEALSTYSERLFYERLYPQALDWWWAYRVNLYEPHGWVDGSIYNPAGFWVYRDAIYLNGAVFLEALRELVGDEIFFAFLKDYVDQNSHRLATGEDFFTLLRQHTQADLDPLIQQYFSNQALLSQ